MLKVIGHYRVLWGGGRTLNSDYFLSISLVPIQKAAKNPFTTYFHYRDVLQKCLKPNETRNHNLGK